MNKQFELLLMQAIQETGSAVLAETQQRFAELIVKECVDIIQRDVSMRYKDGREQHGESDDWEAGHYTASVQSRALLKQHFGLE